MPANQPTLTQLSEAAFLGGMVTLPIQWVADTVVNRRIVKVTSAHGFLNVGLGWDFAYRMSTGTIFPLQHLLYDASLTYVDKPYQNIWTKTALGSITGTLLSLAETRLFHPLDTMKVLAQTNPAIFQRESLRYCYAHYWGSLSAGVRL